MQQQQLKKKKNLSTRKKLKDTKGHATDIEQTLRLWLFSARIRNEVVHTLRESISSSREKLQKASKNKQGGKANEQQLFKLKLDFCK